MQVCALALTFHAVGVAEGVIVAVRVEVGVGVDVPVCVGVGVVDGDAFAEIVADAEGVMVCVGVCVTAPSL